MNYYNYEDYNICICEAPTYSFNSADNKYYDKVISIETTDFNKCIEIEINKVESTKTILLVVPYYTPIGSCVVVNTNGLFLMLDSVICILNLETLEISKQEELNTMGTMFEAHSYEADYILYGEMEIYRISSDLEVVWQFSARDTFVRYQGEEPAFEMKQDRICLIDFLDNYYEIDYDGNVLLDKPIAPHY